MSCTAKTLQLLMPRLRLASQAAHSGGERSVCGAIHSNFEDLRKKTVRNRELEALVTVSLLSGCRLAGRQQRPRVAPKPTSMGTRSFVGYHLALAVKANEAYQDVLGAVLPSAI